MTPLRQIVLTLAEGPAGHVPRTANVTSWADADAQLGSWRAKLLAGDRCGYGSWKCDFTVRWADGQEIAGRYDLSADPKDGLRALAVHVQTSCRFCAGRDRPERFTAEQHAVVLARIGQAAQASCGAILDGCAFTDAC